MLRAINVAILQDLVLLVLLGFHCTKTMILSRERVVLEQYLQRLEYLTSVTNQSIQPVSRVAGRDLVNSLLLDNVETEIYL
jgi:hypothetical protein